ncbi:folate-sensitive fragile site protein Fra10Ac1-domain-containing protein [Auriculariales sp. MPI-PUGE-AT-0066]|nr:folate-sensitive fragile site protein Fra10Ac1-domain-containing protein [Auriculariales sp. MPI-PUGE-AT-0066]
MSSEYDVLKDAHRFLRDDTSEQPRSWAEHVARNYESGLFREFAVCDLKHFKSGNLALRWRTEDEVLSGAGQDTCGNTRCKRHSAEAGSRKRPELKTLELPFAYTERDEQFSALVKVVLCESCCRKLMWKRNHDKAQAATLDDVNHHPSDESRASSRLHISHRPPGRDARSASPRRRDDSSRHRRRPSRSPRRRDTHQD